MERPHISGSLEASFWDNAEGSTGPILDHQLGYRLKRAGYSYLQARSEEARRFCRALKKTAVKPGETIVFEDETGFTLHLRLGVGWAKVGKRLRVLTTRQHRERLNLFGWVAPFWDEGELCDGLKVTGRDSFGV